MKPPKALRFCLASMAILVGGTSVAAASESGWYYQLNLGVANYSNPLTDVVDNVESAAADQEVVGTGFVDESDSTWSLAMGYRVNPYFAIELAYVNLGYQGFAGSGDAQDLPWELIDPENGADFDPSILSAYTVTIDGDLHSAGALVDVIGSFPINNFELSGRLGVFFAKTKLTTQISFEHATDPTMDFKDSFPTTRSTTTVMAGVGAGYTFFDHLQVRVDYSFYQDVGDAEDTLETDISTITAGVAYRF